MPIVLSVASDSTPENYQVKIDLNSGDVVGTNWNWDNECVNSNSSRAKFLNEAEDTELDFWVESCSVVGETMIVWVEVDQSIPTAPGYTIYMYYGNSEAEAKSDGDATFEFFDDFEGENIDTDRWDVSNSSNFSVSGGWITRIEGGGYEYLQTKEAVGGVSFAVEQYLNVTAVGDPGYPGYGNMFYDGAYDGVSWYGESADWDRYVAFNGSGTFKPGVDRGLPTGEVRLTTIKEDGKLRMITTGSRNFDDNWTGTTNNDDKKVRIFHSASTYTVSVDWVFVRNYTSPEPTYLIGSEEAGGEGNGEAVPEFTTITFIIAAVCGFGIYFVIRRAKEKAAK